MGSLNADCILVSVGVQFGLDLGIFPAGSHIADPHMAIPIEFGKILGQARTGFGEFIPDIGQIR